MLHVDDIPNGGGRAALARLPWPGYEVDGGRLEEPVDGFLLTIEVPEDAVGKTITVSFIPPGWMLGVVLWFVGVGSMLTWATIDLIRRRQTNKTVRQSVTEQERVLEFSD
jgi:hypothetical protein